VQTDGHLSLINEIIFFILINLS